MYSLHKADLPSIENLCSYNIVRLDLLNYNYFPDYFNLVKLCLSVCPRLKFLALDITEEEQLNWLKSTGLEYLHINVLRRAEKLNVDNLLEKFGSNLQCLKIKNCILSISKLAVSCPKLDHLEIKYRTFSDNPDDSEQIFRHLRCFAVCYINDNNSSTCEALRLLLLCAPLLQSIFFVECVLSPEIKLYILKCCENLNLNMIAFHQTQVDVNFLIDVLSSCSTSTILDLREWDFNTYDNIMALINFAYTLPNKPRVLIDGDGPS